MKYVLTIISLFSCYSIFAQDSLARREFGYEVITNDSVSILKGNVLNSRNSSSTIICFQSEAGISMAYQTEDKNKWIAIPLPFSRPTLSIQQFNLDRKGKEEIILRGEIVEYGSGGGQGICRMIIFNVDSIPTQIFDVVDCCFEEAFGRKDVEPYLKIYTRKITLRKRKVIVSSIQKKKFPYPDCEITKIPAGTYIMTKGEMRRKR